MKPQTLLLSLLIATPFSAAGNLECNPQPVQQGVPTVYRCTYHNGNLAQAYTALSTSCSDDCILRFNFPHMPRQLPARNFTYCSHNLYDEDGDGKNEIYPLELTIRHQGSNRVQIDYMESNPGSIYGRKTLLRRKGRNVEIIIKDYAA